MFVILTGWKEISKHLRYGVRTLQRWERKGLPVKRINNSPRSPVVADSDDLDAWILRLSRVPPGAPKDLLNNIRRTQELRREIEASKDEFQKRVQTFRKGLAEFRLKRTK